MHDINKYVESTGRLSSPSATLIKSSYPNQPHKITVSTRIKPGPFRRSQVSNNKSLFVFTCLSVM